MGTPEWADRLAAARQEKSARDERDAQIGAEYEAKMAALDAEWAQMVAFARWFVPEAAAAGFDPVAVQCEDGQVEAAATGWWVWMGAGGRHITGQAKGVLLFMAHDGAMFQCDRWFQQDTKGEARTLSPMRVQSLTSSGGARENAERARQCLINALARGTQDSPFAS